MLIRSLFSAFLMYSRIPVPQVEWKEENRRYALCFFPLIGAVIGVFFMLWTYAAEKLEIGPVFKGAVFMLISMAVTGGIHFDGFCDVSDAVSSWGDKQKRLEIMKDSHVGAFAVISLAVCLIAQTAVYSEISGYGTAVVISAGCILSRALSGICAVCLKCAKNDGALQSFVKPSHKKISQISLAVTALAAVALMFIFGGITGLAAAAAAFAVLVYYRVTAYRRFGGITGDTEGWFLVMCEVFLSAAAVLAEKITEVF